MTPATQIENVGNRPKDKSADYAKTYSFLMNVLKQYGVEEWAARGLLNFVFKKVNFSDADFEKAGLPDNLIRLLKNGAELFIRNADNREKFKIHLDQLTSEGSRVSTFSGAAKPAEENKRCAVSQPYPTKDLKPINVTVVSEDDIVTARYRARVMAADLGFSKTNQIKISTAVSELARNIFKYAGKGTITIEKSDLPKTGILIKAEDRGPGIPNLQEILDGAYKSKTGMGLGIVSCRRLMDEFEIISTPNNGTSVTIKKYVA